MRIAGEINIDFDTYEELSEEQIEKLRNVMQQLCEELSDAFTDRAEQMKIEIETYRPITFGYLSE